MGNPPSVYLVELKSLSSSSTGFSTAPNGTLARSRAADGGQCTCSLTRSFLLGKRLCILSNYIVNERHSGGGLWNGAAAHKTTQPHHFSSYTAKAKIWPEVNNIRYAATAHRSELSLCLTPNNTLAASTSLSIHQGSSNRPCLYLFPEVTMWQPKPLAISYGLWNRAVNGIKRISIYYYDQSALDCIYLWHFSYNLSRNYSFIARISHTLLRTLQASITLRSYFWAIGQQSSTTEGPKPKVSVSGQIPWDRTSTIIGDGYDSKKYRTRQTAFVDPLEI